MRRAPTPASKPTTRSGEQAYDCYLLGRQHLARMMQRGLEEGRQMFDRAIELDPAYGPAWAGLATVHACRHEWFDAGKESLALADQASRRAIEAAPQLAEAHVARGLVRSQSKNYDEAVCEFEEAIRRNPYLFDALLLLRARGRRPRRHGARGRHVSIGDAGPARGFSERHPAGIAAEERSVGTTRRAMRCVPVLRRAELVLALNPCDGRALSLGAAALVDDDRADRALEFDRQSPRSLSA